MELHEFRSSLASGEPPEGLSPALQALWADARGDWEAAHMLIQYEDGPEPAWVHAYLHRKEGDDSNAAYWYSRAGKPVCRQSLEEEWTSITETLLG